MFSFQIIEMYAMKDAVTREKGSPKWLLVSWLCLIATIGFRYKTEIYNSFCQVRIKNIHDE